MLMKININYISAELNNIINKYTEYPYKIVLYCLAAQEIIYIIRKTNNIPIMFIKIIEHLKKYLNCYIDFDLLLYVSKNNKKIVLEEDIYDDLAERIQDMLVEDSILLDNIISNNIQKDAYGKVRKNVSNIAHKLFNNMDQNKDGYITAIDIVRISNMCDKYTLIFEHNFIQTMTYILVKKKYIDYYTFLYNLF